MRQKNGFSLVELSIVLVVIGLLVGGVLAGKSLLRSADMRSIVAQYHKYVTAGQAFKDKYGELPGDMPNATTYWGTANANPATCVDTATTTGTATCNGDGNGSIGVAAGSNELYRFWQQLSNAGLIDGKYDGISHGSTEGSATAANSPAGRAGNGLWWVADISDRTSDGSIFDGAYGNTFEYGFPIVNGDPAGAIFTPTELWNIDSKLDDGYPGTGKVMARDINGWTGTNCTTATASNQTTTAKYNLSNSNILCSMLFPHVF